MNVKKFTFTDKFHIFKFKAEHFVCLANLLTYKIKKEKDTTTSSVHSYACLIRDLLKTHIVYVKRSLKVKKKQKSERKRKN